MQWSVGEGNRVYAIGDMHGRADLFAHMLRAIRIDADGRPPCRTTLVVLGDFVDRGPRSAELSERLRRYEQASDRFIVLRGNHEDLMARALGGDMAALRGWLAIGGGATMASWSVAAPLIAEGATSELMHAVRRAVPDYMVSWLRSLPLMFEAGSVLFVHAGIRPLMPLAAQHPHDLLWIRDEFTSSDVLHSHLVVHGHSVSEAVVDLDNRIGLDTGAYASGLLTAAGFEERDHWILST